MPITPGEIIDFWTETVGEKRWYAVEPALDDMIRARYESLWREARAGELPSWEETADGALALVIVLDQFPRNMFRDTANAFASDEQARTVARRAIAMFRDTANAFASDEQARTVARRAIASGFDLEIGLPLRQFFYLPFEHSESLTDQERSVALFAERLGKNHYTYPYALEHREEIARFGRFPSRNKALGRVSTAEEQDFLDRKMKPD